MGLLVGAIILTFFVFLPYMDSIVLSATFAIVFAPIYDKILRWLGGKRRSLSAVIIVSLVFLLIFIPLVIFSLKLFEEAVSLYTQLSSGDSSESSMNHISRTLESYTKRTGIPFNSLQISEYMRTGLEWSVKHLGSVFSSVINAIGFFFLSLLGLYYFLKDGKKFSAALEGLAPLSPEHTELIFNKLYITVNSVVKGTLSVAVVQGLLTGVGFAIFGVPSAVFWGFVAIITSLIPVVGTAVIIFPAIIYLFISGSPFHAAGLLIWGVLVVGLVDNLLRPLLLEKSVNIHPFLILLSVLGGLGFFGPIGFLMGPLVLSFLFALLEIYATAVLKKEKVPEIA